MVKMNKKFNNIHVHSNNKLLFTMIFMYSQISLEISSQTLFSSPKWATVITCHQSVYTLNDLSSETPNPIFFKFHLEHSVNERFKIISNGHRPSIKMAPICPYTVKTLKSPSPEPRKLWGWILIYCIGDSRSTRFIQRMILCWQLAFLWQGQICIPRYKMYLHGENIKKKFLKNP